MKTAVIIRKHKRHNQSVIAFFPTLPGTNDPATCSAYDSSEEHVTADVGYASPHTIPASDVETAEMLRRLQSLGYDDLTPVSRFSPSHKRARIAAMKR